MNINLTNTETSAAIIGAIVGGIVAFLLGFLNTFITQQIRRKGVCHMLMFEVEINTQNLSDVCSITDKQICSSDHASELPVRSNYLWEALRGEVPGLLSYKQVKALADFYYMQAQVYKMEREKKIPMDELCKKHVPPLIIKGNDAHKLLKKDCLKIRLNERQ